jgi:signal transduction histidine kinase
MTEQDKQDVPMNSAMAINSDSAASEASRPAGNEAEEKIRALVADYEARIDEVADLIARVRHEINNPLAGVLGQAQLLLREELNEKARKRAQTIEELAVRMRDIVAQLRQVQRISKS